MPSWKKKKNKKAKGKEGQNNDPSPAKMEAAKVIILGVETKCLKRDKKSVEKDIENGMQLIKAEQMLFGKGQSKRGNWGKYLKQFRSELKLRTIQRYIQMAKNVDLEENPTLAYLGQTDLLRLIQLGKGKTPAEVLGDGGVDIVFDGKDGEARKQFQSETKKLISTLAAEHRESKGGKESSSEPGNESVKTLTKLKKLLSQPEELAAFGKRLEGDEELQADNKCVRMQLRKLAPAIMKRAGRSSGRKKVKPKKVTSKR